jgi:hypothetical protein
MKNMVSHSVSVSRCYYIAPLGLMNNTLSASDYHSYTFITSILHHLNPSSPHPFITSILHHLIPSSPQSFIPSIPHPRHPYSTTRF